MVQNQLYSLIIYIISGIVIGIFFDVFRVIRKTFKTPDIITYIEDILFWILTGTFLLLVIFVFQNGQIRSYTIVGLVIGSIIYFIAISKYFIKINICILKYIKFTISKIIKILMYPLKIIFKPFSFIVININNCFKTKINKKIQKNAKI